jgi:hypothetical protein
LTHSFRVSSLKYSRQFSSTVCVLHHPPISFSITRCPYWHLRKHTGNEIPRCWCPKFSDYGTPTHAFCVWTLFITMRLFTTRRFVDWVQLSSSGETYLFQEISVSSVDRDQPSRFLSENGDRLNSPKISLK